MNAQGRDKFRRSESGFTIVELTVVIAIFAVLFAALAPFVRMVRARAHIINCANNLRRISLGLHMYAADHNEAFPPNLGALYPDYIGDEKVFDCPATNMTGRPERPDYKYVTGITESSSSKEMIAEDLDANHRKAGRNMLRINGSVEFMTRRP